MNFIKFRREIARLNYAMKADKAKLNAVYVVCNALNLRNSCLLMCFLLWSTGAVELVDKSLINGDDITMIQTNPSK